jgi:16S rRNA (cytidine1402-2'-O)-methyltransferase
MPLMSTLYLVATPIGNMEDITLRALRVLRDVPLIAAEDTRTARVLLRRYDIATRTTSYNEHNSRAKTPAILRALSDGDVALTSDAGMPAISDPGHHLVVAALAAGHDVIAIPGASALVTALAASGLPARRFHYLGFLPRQSGARQRALLAAASSGDTLVVYESPHRLRATLSDARAALGDRRVTVCRELTKLHEEVWRGTIDGALEHFTTPRGEFTLVMEGGPGPDGAPGDVHEPVADVLEELHGRGAPGREAVAALMHRCGLSRRAAYAAWHHTPR